MKLHCTQEVENELGGACELADLCNKKLLVKLQAVFAEPGRLYEVTIINSKSNQLQLQTTQYVKMWCAIDNVLVVGIAD